ncbi:MAG: hypothetical protein ACK4TK_02960 [Thiobacillaceae bacterium]
MTDLQTWHCWQCGADISDLPRPYDRFARCPTCRAELHVCRMCRHYDPTKAKHCREPLADEVKDKTRANTCEWFQAAPRASAPPARPDRDSRRELDTLFGADPNETEPPTTDRQALDRLFGAGAGDPSGDPHS